MHAEFDVSPYDFDNFHYTYAEYPSWSFNNHLQVHLDESDDYKRTLVTTLLIESESEVDAWDDHQVQYNTHTQAMQAMTEAATPHSISCEDAIRLSADSLGPDSIYVTLEIRQDPLAAPTGSLLLQTSELNHSILSRVPVLAECGPISVIHFPVFIDLIFQPHEPPLDETPDTTSEIDETPGLIVYYCFWEMLSTLPFDNEGSVNTEAINGPLSDSDTLASVDHRASAHVASENSGEGVSSAVELKFKAQRNAKRNAARKKARLAKRSAKGTELIATSAEEEDDEGLPQTHLKTAEGRQSAEPGSSNTINPMRPREETTTVAESIKKHPHENRIGDARMGQGIPANGTTTSAQIEIEGVGASSTFINSDDLSINYYEQQEPEQFEGAGNSPSDEMATLPINPDGFILRRTWSAGVELSTMSSSKPQSSRKAGRKSV